MSNIKPIYLYIAGGVLALVVAFYLFSCFWPSQPPAIRRAAGELTKKQEAATIASIDKQHELARQDTAASKKATDGADKLQGRAARSQAAADKLSQEAVIIHRQSKAHAIPVPTTAADIAKLQSFFDHYGDSTANLR